MASSSRDCSKGVACKSEAGNSTSCKEHSHHPHTMREHAHTHTHTHTHTPYTHTPLSSVSDRLLQSWVSVSSPCVLIGEPLSGVCVLQTHSRPAARLSAGLVVYDIPLHDLIDTSSKYAGTSKGHVTVQYSMDTPTWGITLTTDHLRGSEPSQDRSCTLLEVNLQEIIT